MATLEWSATGAVVCDVQTVVSDADILAAAPGADKVGIDAPFGWPDAFVDVVSAHHIGDVPHEQSLFTDAGVTRFVARRTDEWVRATTGLIPLSVSADRIAYVALRAIRLLAHLDGPDFDTGRVNGTAVEAYPAAALKIWGFRHKRYKGRPQQVTLAELVGELEIQAPWLDFGSARTVCTTSDDAFDAVITALIARAAALNLTVLPDAEHAAIAQREGWIHIPGAPLDALVAQLS